MWEASQRRQRARSMSITSSRCRRQSKPGLRAHRGAHAAHQHPDVGRLARRGGSSRRAGRARSARRSARAAPPARPAPASRSARRRPPARAGSPRRSARGRALRRSRPSSTANGSRRARERLARAVGEQPELLAHELHQQRLLGREVPVDGARHRRRRGARRRPSAPRPRTRANTARALSRIRSRLRRASARSGRSVSLEGWSQWSRSFPPARLTSGIIVHYSRGAQPEPEVSFQ